MIETTICPCSWASNRWGSDLSLSKKDVCGDCECNPFSEYNPTVEELLFNQKAIGMYNE